MVLQHPWRMQLVAHSCLVFFDNSVFLFLWLYKPVCQVIPSWWGWYPQCSWRDAAGDVGGLWWHYWCQLPLSAPIEVAAVHGGRGQFAACCTDTAEQGEPALGALEWLILLSPSKCDKKLPKLWLGRRQGFWARASLCTESSAGAGGLCSHQDNLSICPWRLSVFSQELLGSLARLFVGQGSWWTKPCNPTSLFISSLGGHIFPLESSYQEFLSAANAAGAVPLCMKSLLDAATAELDWRLTLLAGVRSLIQILLCNQSRTENVQNKMCSSFPSLLPSLHPDLQEHHVMSRWFCE